jgi:hypothetical protein
MEIYKGFQGSAYYKELQVASWKGIHIRDISGFKGESLEQ